ncbi:hypothetical protein [Sewage-associated circular DNA virus-25]|uniref:hypothetical protein n=1 Tax=Sewage-associated circular DNA virus-25 TaxID=1592092 RepID=UPI00058613FE|nr:hypothetical protein [Sewage-associated circular DNA virus-25]AJD07543.1 hypothetical protein [Sewage-associated circular DNA virus-25]
MGDVRFINELLPGLIPIPLVHLSQYILDKGREFAFSENPAKEESKEKEVLPKTTTHPEYAQRRYQYKTSVHPYRPVPINTSRAYKFYDIQLELYYALEEISNLSYTEPYSYINGYTLINFVPHGLTSKQRVNNNVVIKSINIRFVCLLDVTSIYPDPITIRWLLIYDRDTNKAAPATTDIFEQNSAYKLTFNSPLNHVFTSRFSVIRDKYLILDPKTSSSVVVNEYIKGEWPTAYDLSFSQIPSIVIIKSGALFFLIFCDNSANTLTIAHDINIRLRFADTTTKN